MNGIHGKPEIGERKTRKRRGLLAKLFFGQDSWSLFQCCRACPDGERLCQQGWVGRDGRRFYRIVRTSKWAERGKGQLV